MIIQQIRNATMRVTYGGKTFLMDPWLAPKGEPSPYTASHFLSRHTTAGSGDAPLCPLPFPAERILADVDACIVTHIHPTHIDMDADGRPGGRLDRNLVMYVQNREDVRAFRRSGFCARAHALVHVLLPPHPREQGAGAQRYHCTLRAHLRRRFRMPRREDAVSRR